MSDPREIVEQIQSRIRAGRLEDSAALRELAEAYAEACGRANARLRECDDRIGRGLRSEAVHLAEADPPLLDAVAALDFAEQDDWLDVCLRHDYEPPEPLDAAAAAALEEEYLVADSVGGLMRRQRMLALARAPLDRRIEVLRRIAAADPNPQWEADLADWQGVRVKQIEREAAAAAKAGRASGLRAAAKELSREDWVVDLPPTLTDRVKGAAARLTRSAAAAKAATLAPRLAAAHEAGDEAKARRLRGDFEAAAEAGGLGADDAAREEAGGALGWLASLDDEAARSAEYARTVAALEEGLDEGADLEELQRHASELSATGMGPPEELAMRYRTAVGGQQRARSRKRAAVVAVGVLALAGVAAGAAAAYQAAALRGRVETLVTGVDAEIAAGRLEQARGLLDAAPDLAGEEAVAAGAGRLKEAVAARQALLGGLRNDAGRMAEAGSRGELQDLYAGAIGRLEGLPSGLHDEQLALLDGARGARLAELDAVREQQLAAFDGGLKKATAEVVRLEGEPVPLEETLAVRDRVSARLGELSGVASQLDQGDASHRLTQLGAVRERLERVVADRRLADRWDRRAADVAASAAEAARLKGRMRGAAFDRFLGDLADFSASFEGRPQAEAVTATVEAESEVWRGVLDWGSFAAEPGLRPADWREAEERAGRGREILERTPGLPVAADAEAYLAFLESVARRKGDFSPTLEMAAFLEDERLSEAYAFTTADGRTFYARADQKDYRELNRQFEHFDRLGSGRGPVRATPEMKAGRDFARFVDVRPAPHGAVCRSMLTDLRRHEEGAAGYLEAFASAAAKAAGAEGVPPALRLTLLQRVIEQAGRGHEALRQSLLPAEEVLDQAGWKATANWLDPGYVAGADKTREDAEKAERVLRRLPPLGPLFEAAEGRLANILAAASRPARPAGVGLPRPFGEPGVWVGLDKGVGGPLFVAEPSGSWRPLGEGRGGQVIEADAGAAGRLVFWRPELEVETASAAAGGAGR